MTESRSSNPHPAPASAGAGRFLPPALALWFVAAIVVAGGTSSAARPYADGAPPGFTGGFKEESCHACHFDFEPNTRPGEVSLKGVPERYVAGQQYPLTITLTRPGMRLGGFQLAARHPDGTQAGTLQHGSGEDTRVKVETQGNVHYAGQRRPGADPSAPDTATWTLVWTAPMSSEPVTFSVAANAADNDESVRGDYVYTASAQSRP